MIIWWKTDDEVVSINNDNGTIKLFNTLKEADAYCNDCAFSNDMRVISIEAVKE